MIWKMHPAQEVYSRSQSFDENFIRVKIEFQAQLQESAYSEIISLYVWRNCIRLMLLIIPPPQTFATLAEDERNLHSVVQLSANSSQNTSLFSGSAH